MAKFFIVWNASRTEGFVTDDINDAQQCLLGITGNGSTVGIAFFEAYEDDERTLQEIELP